MKLPGFTVAEYQASSPLIAAYQAVNCYPESGPNMAFKGVPGTLLAYDFTDSVRGLWEAWGRLYVVAGSTLYSVASDNTVTNLGSVVDDGLPVSMTHNIFELLCVSGGLGYVVQKDTNVFSTITDTDFPNSTQADFLDGYGILLEINSGRFWYTTINDFETISGIDFATAEGSPDDLVSLIVDHRELLLFGRRTTEVWYNAGTATNPIQRRTFIERGCIGSHSPAKADNSVFWLGDDMIVYRLDNYQPIRISNHGIEHLISETTVDPIGFAYTDSGHVFYQLNFPGELSVDFDVSTGLWHRRKAREQADAAYHHHAFAHGKHYVGGDKLYTLDNNTYQHNGDELERIQRFGPIRGNRYNKLRRLRAVFETGENSNALDPQKVFLKISDDAARTFGTRIEASVGTQGQYRTEVQFHALGGFYDAERVLELTMTDNARYTLVDIDVA